MLKKIRKNGFYLVLFLCITAIGVSGYVMFMRPEPTPLADEISFPETTEFTIPEPEPEEIIIPEPTPVIMPEPVPESVPEPVTEPAPTPEKLSEPLPNQNDKKSVAVMNPQTPKSENDYIIPIEGDILQVFTDDKPIKNVTLGDWRTHPAIDIAASEGDKVCAAADGVVSEVLNDALMGNIVKITHSDGAVTVYANLAEEIPVKKDDKVKAGDAIGSVGRSAIAEYDMPYHLHFEFISDNVPKNPLEKIK